MRKHKRLSYNDLANIYHRETGRHARIQRVEAILQWAERRTDLFEWEEGNFLRLKLNKKSEKDVLENTQEAVL